MTSTERLPGNPFAIAPELVPPSDQAAVSSQMAVAKELHTANLIAMLDRLDNADRAEAMKQIRAGLGFN